MTTKRKEKKRIENERKQNDENLTISFQHILKLCVYYLFIRYKHVLIIFNAHLNIYYI